MGSFRSAFVSFSFANPYMKLSISSFCNKKERWGLTKTGLVVFLTGCAAIFLFVFFQLYNFLSVSDPIKAEFLVVEGWVPDHVVKRAVDDFSRNNCVLIFCVGGPIQTGSYLFPFNNFANFTYYRLIKLGVIESKIVAIETDDVVKDRTYESALALKKWASNIGLELKSINVYTLGSHARRSRFLFRKALGDTVEVGIIGVVEQTFDPKAWWKNSNGFRTVIDETIAYIYAITYFNLSNSFILIENSRRHSCYNKQA
jgi:hypothetical protein